MQKGDMSKGEEAGEVAKDMKKSRCEKVCSSKTQGLVKEKNESYMADRTSQIRKKHLELTPRLYRQSRKHYICTKRKTKRKLY